MGARDQQSDDKTGCKHANSLASSSKITRNVGNSPSLLCAQEYGQPKLNLEVSLLTVMDLQKAAWVISLLIISIFFQFWLILVSDFSKSNLGALLVAYFVINLSDCLSACVSHLVLLAFSRVVLLLTW